MAKEELTKHTVRQQAREKRLKSELRANLRKRKEKARSQVSQIDNGASGDKKDE